MKVSKNLKKLVAVAILLTQLKTSKVVSNLLNIKAVNAYHDITKSFSLFLTEEEITDPQLIYECFNYAMWNGYFSDNHELGYTLERDIYWDNAGMSIMSGNGVCLNYSDMLTLVFKEMGYNSGTVFCYLDPNNCEIDKIRINKEIERKNSSEGENSGSFDFFLDVFTKLVGNHAITCVEYNGDLYFYCPTNFAYLNKTGLNDLDIINGSGKFDLKYFPTILMENINLFKVVPYTNEDGSLEVVLEKKELDIDMAKLEEFYRSQMSNIATVSKTNERNNLFLMYICMKLTDLIFKLLFSLLHRVAKKIKKTEIESLIPRLKEVFSEANIKTEFGVIKSCELIDETLEDNNCMANDLFRKAIMILDDIVNGELIKYFMISSYLNSLGYPSTILYAKKNSNKFTKKKIPLISFSNNTNTYLYDYETGELLCKDSGGVLCSLDGKYWYELENDDNEQYFNKGTEHMSCAEVQEMMNEAVILDAKQQGKIRSKVAENI